MPVRFRLSTLLLFVAVVAVILFLIDNTQVAVWYGRFPLQVDLRNPHDRRIIEVAAETLSRIEDAQYATTAPSKLDLHPTHVDWIAGQPFSVDVPCSGRTSWFGRELSYGQHKLLVLQISYLDENVDFIPVVIPDGRTIRTVTVSVAERKPPN